MFVGGTIDPTRTTVRTRRKVANATGLVRPFRWNRFGTVACRIVPGLSVGIEPAQSLGNIVGRRPAAAKGLTTRYSRRSRVGISRIAAGVASPDAVRV